MRTFHALSRFLLLLIFLAAGSGCMSAYKETMGGEPHKVIHRIFLTDFNTAWQAVLDSLKHAQFDVSNREAGFLQTRWADNTSEKNFVDSFGNADAFLKAQYRFRVTVAKGYYNGRPSVKVSVQKEQLVQRDVLEGWQPIESEPTEENTLLYRIGRIIVVKTKLAMIEEERTKKELQDVKF